jgi:hypothetical protein
MFILPLGIEKTLRVFHLEVQVGTRLQSTIKKERAVIGMKSVEVTQRVKTFSEEHCDSSQAGKSEMPDNIVSLVNKRLLIYYTRTSET